MKDDPIVAEVRRIREEIFKEFDCSLEAYAEDLRRTQALHTDGDGRFIYSADASSLKVAEDSLEYKKGND